MGAAMSTPARASERDLVALAGIVSEDRPDLPADGGLPESLLADLMGQIRCDGVDLLGFDSGQQAFWFGQCPGLPALPCRRGGQADGRELPRSRSDRAITVGFHGQQRCLAGRTNL
jgi:hypothetical protein